MATSEIYYHRRREYIESLLNVSDPIYDLTPTPSGQSRTIGGWTLGMPLGKGASGKVYAATDSKSTLVAIKIVEHGSNLEERIRVLKKLGALEKSENGHRRILRLKEIIYPSRGRQNAFEEIALVLEPAVRATFTQLTKAAADRLCW